MDGREIGLRLQLHRRALAPSSRPACRSLDFIRAYAWLAGRGQNPRLAIFDRGRVEQPTRPPADQGLVDPAASGRFAARGSTAHVGDGWHDCSRDWPVITAVTASTIPDTPANARARQADFISRRVSCGCSLGALLRPWHHSRSGRVACIRKLTRECGAGLRNWRLVSRLE